MTTICIARLRSKSVYTKPLEHICDSFYYLLERFRKDNQDLNYTYYNFSFGDVKAERNVDAIKNADVIIIPSEAEFTYHIPGYIHTLDVKKSNEELEKIKPYFEGKTVIILRSDRRDNIELYANSVLTNVNCVYEEIDECDFPVNIHGLKYWFIKDLQENQLYPEESERYMDFIYWGGDKKKTIGGKPSGDTRHLTLKYIHDDPKIKSFWVGRYANIKRNEKFMSMEKLTTFLNSSKTTLCFNWMDPKATTSRYIEALACGILPLVWHDYDVDNTLVWSHDLRMDSPDEAAEVIKAMSKHERARKEIVDKATDALLDKLPTKDQYYEMFVDKLNAALFDKIVLDIPPIL